MKCLNCNKNFCMQSVNQKYCCRRCGDQYRRTHRITYPSLSFRCAQCGRMVKTEDGGHDKRTRFCCEQCEKKFWKHPHWENTSTRINFRSIGEYERYERRTNEL